MWTDKDWTRLYLNKYTSVFGLVSSPGYRQIFFIFCLTACLFLLFVDLD